MATYNLYTLSTAVLFRHRRQRFYAHSQYSCIISSQASTVLCKLSVQLYYFVTGVNGFM